MSLSQKEWLRPPPLPAPVVTVDDNEAVADERTDHVAKTRALDIVQVVFLKDMLNVVGVCGDVRASFGKADEAAILVNLADEELQHAPACLEHVLPSGPRRSGRHLRCDRLNLHCPLRWIGGRCGLPFIQREPTAGLYCPTTGGQHGSYSRPTCVRIADDGRRPGERTREFVTAGRLVNRRSSRREPRSGANRWPASAADIEGRRQRTTIPGERHEPELRSSVRHRRGGRESGRRADVRPSRARLSDRVSD